MKALIVAPFWRTPGHVGNYRIDRFVRWLHGRGVLVTLVRAGSRDGAVTTEWGTEVTISDPLKIYNDANGTGSASNARRKPNAIRRYLAYILLSPDPTVVWARRVTNHPLVREHAKGTAWVISSSPPESCHVVSAALARSLSAKLIIDMRDGWLDEPLKPLLRCSRFQRWREGRIESAVLRSAHRVFVTSDAWRQMLTVRLPFTLNKTEVLTNGYPREMRKPNAAPRTNGLKASLQLIHAGRFTGSSLSRTPTHLLRPVYDVLPIPACQGSIVLIGALEQRDLRELEFWQKRFEERSWSLEIRDPVPQARLMEHLGAADGLLLLSASQAAIPSKLFDYLVLPKPILAATPRGSAVWRISETVPQMFAFDYDEPDTASATRLFLEACRRGGFRYVQPEEFDESFLSRIFLDQVFSA